MGLFGLEEALEASAPGGGWWAEKEAGCANWRLSRLIWGEESRLIWGEESRLIWGEEPC